MNREQVHELLYQALETERGGINIYRTAIKCAQNEDLKKEWKEYLDQTENHERVLLEVFEELGLDPVEDTPGRAIVRHIGESLVKAMEMALKNGEPAACQLVAAECVVLAETKDHQNWEMIGAISKSSSRPEGKRLKEAYDEVEDEEDEHLYHTMGWARELWLESIGLPAVLPPPEEEKDVKTMAAAAKAKANRKKML